MEVVEVVLLTILLQGIGFRINLIRSLLLDLLLLLLLPIKAEPCMVAVIEMINGYNLSKNSKDINHSSIEVIVDLTLIHPLPREKEEEGVSEIYDIVDKIIKLGYWLALA